MPKKVKYKPRKKSTLPLVKKSADRAGRTFSDFVNFIKENPDLSIVEMDTVHGTPSGKVLLTFMFRSCSLMLALIIESCSQAAVKDVIDKLYGVLGHDVFKRSVTIILTDNGSELKNPEALKLDELVNQRTME